LRDLSFTHTQTTESYPLSLHDALPIYPLAHELEQPDRVYCHGRKAAEHSLGANAECERRSYRICGTECIALAGTDREHRKTCDGNRKSTRLNSSHVKISYAVFCLKKKK